MNHSRRKKLLVIVLLTVLIGLPGWTVYHDARQQHLNNALIEAGARLDVKGVNALLAQGADPNARDIPEEKPVFWQRLLQMLRPGSQHNTEQESGHSVLYVALHGPNVPDWPFDIPVPRKHRVVEGIEGAGSPFLFLASTKRLSPFAPDEAIVQTLVQHGANVREADKEDAELLGRVIIYGSISTLKLLLEYGANPNGANKDAWLNQDFPPLILAVVSGNREKVRLLLQHGANVNTRTASDTTALYWAKFPDDKPMIALLKQEGAK